MYQGVKSFISQYKKPFDSDAIALAMAKKRLRERGISTSSRSSSEAIQEEKLAVLAEWKQIADNGSIAHEEIQNREMEKNENSIFEGYQKLEKDQILSEKTVNHVDRNMHYYEKQVVLNDIFILGYIDHLYIDEKGYIHIEDYKTFEKFTIGYTFIKNNIKFIENYFNPVKHLVDCKFTDANLQLSFYMYMIWKSNKKLKPGSITITHVVLDSDGKRTGEEIEYKAPYLLDEVKAMIRDQKKKMNDKPSIQRSKRESSDK